LISRGFAVALVVGALGTALAGTDATADQPPEIGGFVGGAASIADGEFTQIADVDVWTGNAADHRTDKIWVLDGIDSASRIQRLDSDGNYELAARLGRGRPGPSRPAGLAVSPKSGDVYVIDGLRELVQRFDRDATPLGNWSVGPGGSAIAVRPTAPFDVFVAEENGARVLQFTVGGSFVATWGWGVSTGADRFEACTERSSCRPGLKTGDTLRNGRWPTHLAVDRDGIVYGSSLPRAPGYVKLSDKLRTRIVRFRAPPDPTAGEAALLPTLQPNAPLTNGTTQGLDIDPSERLLAIVDPFGTSILDVIGRPGSDRRGSSGPVVRPLDTLPFLETVTGIAATGTAGVTLISIGTVDPSADTSSYTGCVRDEAPHDCHGLIVLAPPGPTNGMMAPSPVPTEGTVTLAADVAPHGAAKVRFQVSGEGRRWRNVGAERRVIGTGYERVAVDVAGLEPDTAYKTRAIVGWIGTNGLTWAVTPERLLVSAPAPRS
jgi:hypothetical protein